MKNYPSENVKKFGEELGMALFDADVHRALGGLGGCKHFDLKDFKEADARRCLCDLRRHFSFKFLIKVLLKMKEEESNGERFV